MLDNIERGKQLYSLLNPCRLCPRKCMVDRTAGKTGRCRTGLDVYISSYNIHNGEEPPISGFSGSGTIFFTNCALSCVFCQNYPISQLGHGNKVSVERLSQIMLELEERGAHNINLVTPTHVAAQAVEALALARQAGLKIPLVYNSSGYESVETLKLLEGIVDIYMPDAKYSDPAKSLEYSGAGDYWEANKAALKEMYRQVGNLVMDKNGLATKGLIIRHLVLPNDISGVREVLKFIAEGISKDVYISLMSQYHPAHMSHKYPELSKKISKKEYDKALNILNNLGLANGWVQEL